MDDRDPGAVDAGQLLGWMALGLAATVVAFGVPILALPFLGLLAMPVALPGMLALAVLPALTVRWSSPWPRLLAGGALLLVAGAADLRFTALLMDAAQTALLDRHPPGAASPGDLVGSTLITWGLLVAGVGLGRGARLPGAMAFATALVAVAPVACAVLAAFHALGWPLSA